MKKLQIFFLTFLFIFTSCNNVVKTNIMEKDMKLPSRIKGKYLNVFHQSPTGVPLNRAVLFIHGASFPSSLASGFKIDGVSWIDNLTMAGYDVYALDFLGYGKSDRYDYMSKNYGKNNNIGTASDVVQDIDIVLNFIRNNAKINKISIIGHSWGATVSALYATLHSEKIDKLVLFAPFIQRKGQTEWDKPKELYEDLTPNERIAQFVSKIPKDKVMTLERDVIKKWGKEWLESDPTSKLRIPHSVRFPSAWQVDLFNCWNGKSLFSPTKIENSTLLIRGEWDTTFSFSDAENLFKQLINVPNKRYVVIDKSTHVMHLEKNRFKLFNEVKLFLK